MNKSLKFSLKKNCNVKLVWQIFRRSEHQASHHYFWYLGLCVPVFLSWLIYHALPTVHSQNRWIFLVWSILILLLYLICHYGRVGIHYIILNRLQHLPYVKFHNFSVKRSLMGWFEPFRINTLVAVFLISLYKWILVFLWSLPLIIVSVASQATHNITVMIPFLCLLALIPIIKYNYSYKYSQLMYYEAILKEKYISSGKSIQLSKKYIKGNKINLMILQLFLMIPRLLLATLGLLITYEILKNLLLALGICLIIFILSSLMLYPFIEIPQINFFNYLIKK